MQKVYTFKNLSAQKGCKHLVTKKDLTQKLSFSLALHTKEDPKKILENRSKIQNYFPDMKFVVANQTHSDNISIISSFDSKGWDSQESAIRDCDALITNQKNLMLTILTADCVPILLFDPIRRVVSAIHAGWRGTEKKIVYKTIQKMKQKFGSNPKDIVAGVAPCIMRCCYEVDWEVAKNFVEYKNAFDKIGDKYMLDLPYINREQLLEAGVKKENIELSNICTSCQVDSYFSYRKEGGCSGRFMSMIALI
jgi:YfiH family protein